MRLLRVVLVCSVSGCCFGSAVSSACREACERAEAGDIEGLTTLATDRSVLTCRDDEGFAPIHHAAGHGATATVLWLLDQGVPIELAGASERTPLYEAAKYGQLETARALLDRGANIEARGTTGHTPWLVAAERGNRAVLELLLERGADVTALTNESVDSLHTYLGNSDRHPDVDHVRFLLAHGGGIEIHDSSGFGALMIAAQRGQDEVVPILLEAGANPNITTRAGSTPLDDARYRHLDGIAAVLLAAGGRSSRDTIPDPLLPLTRSLTLPGVVTASGGARPPPVGSRCTVHVRPSSGADRYNCQLTADCENGGQLYGGPTSGFVCCEDLPTGLRAFDWRITPVDGDPAAELDEHARRFWVDDGMPGREGTYAHITLDPASSTEAAAHE